MSLAFLLPLSYFFRINPWQSDYTKYMIISKALEKYSQVVLQRGCIFVLQLLKLHTNVLKLCYFGRGKKYFMAASGCFWRRQWHPTPVLLPGKPLDGGAWQAAVHGVAGSRTRLSNFTFTFHFHALEKEMATHSSVLAWRIPGMGEPGGLPSMGSHRVGHD